MIYLGELAMSQVFVLIVLFNEGTLFSARGVYKSMASKFDSDNISLIDTEVKLREMVKAGLVDYHRGYGINLYQLSPRGKCKAKKLVDSLKFLLSLADST